MNNETKEKELIIKKQNEYEIFVKFFSELIRKHGKKFLKKKRK